MSGGFYQSEYYSSIYFECSKKKGHKGMHLDKKYQVCWNDGDNLK